MLVYNIRLHLYCVVNCHFRLRLFLPLVFEILATEIISECNCFDVFPPNSLCETFFFVRFLSSFESSS